jgi:5-formyltetrahydrofolate cyclo-ligase
MSDSSLSLVKSTLRRALLAQRQDLTSSNRNVAEIKMADRLGDFLSRQPWRSYAVFLPWRGEPNLTRVWNQMHEDGYALALPACLADRKTMQMRSWLLTSPLEKDALGLRAPPASAKPIFCDAWIVPCLGVGPYGERLGAGMGFYDRAFAAIAPGQRPATLGVCFESGRVQTPFAEPHDLLLDACLTEAGIEYFKPSNEADRA